MWNIRQWNQICVARVKSNSEWNNEAWNKIAAWKRRLDTEKMNYSFFYEPIVPFAFLGEY